MVWGLAVRQAATGVRLEEVLLRGGPFTRSLNFDKGEQPVKVARMITLSYVRDLMR